MLHAAKVRKGRGAREGEEERKRLKRENSTGLAYAIGIKTETLNDVEEINLWER